MREEKKMLRVVYTFFLGLILALFVGVGVNTFYPGPTAPEYPVELTATGKELTDEQEVLQRTFEQDMRSYDKAMQPYNRDVSMIALGAAIIFLAISLLAENRIKILSDGVMLGGVFTMMYSIGRSFASQDSKYEFMVVTVGLVVALYLGYHRFVRSHPPTQGKGTLVASD